MKRKPIAALTIVMMGGSAFAASDFTDTAQVISSKPIIERVSESRQECDPAPVPQKSSTNIIAPIIGVVVGGLLGHQVGQNSGKTAATVIGATGGAVAGSVLANRASANAQPAQQCRTVESSREVVNGYDVVYRYNGRDINVALPYDPHAGSTVKVGVSMILDDHAADSGRGGNAQPVNAANGGDSYDSRPGRQRGDVQ
jgi:uncharacterized protein YcfJ